MALEKADKEQEKANKEIIQIVDKLPVQEVRTAEGKVNGEDVLIRFKTVLEYLTEMANNEGD